MNDHILFLEDDMQAHEATVLFLEDEPSLLDYSSSWLKEDIKAEICDFPRIDLAMEFFSKRKDDIACIITDLNMPDEFLENHRLESDGCMLSGWVWLQHYVYNEKPRMPTIIYSGYLSFLRQKLEEKSETHLLEQDHIICVEKGAGPNKGYKGLRNAIIKLLQLPTYGNI